MRPIFALLACLPLALAAAPTQAETRYFAYDPADRLTRSLTGGLTFQVELGLFGRVRVERLYSTAARGSAELDRGGPDQVRQALSPEATETVVYAIVDEGQGRGLIRALCPSADEAWLVFGRIRPAHPVTARAVGRWIDGRFRECAPLSWSFRGEWSELPAGALSEGPGPSGPR